MARALAEDVLPARRPHGRRSCPPTTTARARSWPARAGVVAGRLCALEAFAQVDPAVAVDWRCSTTAAGGGRARWSAVVSGPLRSILTAERTALNFLCHLSGVATAARRFVDAVTAANPADPGPRHPQDDARAAGPREGGGARRRGWNHRGSLSEAVLVKDNHLGGLAIAEAVARARQWWPGRMVEVECDRADQVTEAVDAGASAVLLDNMTPDEVASCVALVRGARRGGGRVLVEVSGGVTLDTAPAYAAAGADLISVGALTHSAPVLDLGLDLEEG